jgi:hypothetical protein
MCPRNCSHTRTSKTRAKLFPSFLHVLVHRSGSLSLGTVHEINITACRICEQGLSQDLWPSARFTFYSSWDLISSPFHETQDLYPRINIKFACYCRINKIFLLFIRHQGHFLVKLFTRSYSRSVIHGIRIDKIFK